MGTFMQPNKYSVMDRMSFALTDRVYDPFSRLATNANGTKIENMLNLEKIDGGTYFWE